MRVQMAVRAIGLDESHRRSDSAEQLVIGGNRSGSRNLRRKRLRFGLGGNRLGRRWRRGNRRCDGGLRLGRCDRRHRRRAAVPVVLGEQLDQSSEPGQRGKDGVVTAFEERAPGGIDRFGILEVLLEEQADVAGVQVRLLRRRSHSYLCTSGDALFLAAAR